MVYKGVMDSGNGEVDVAVKTLKEGSGEEDRVKFLQEAAIMGQFKHHNVVTIYGVITEGEPVSQVNGAYMPEDYSYVASGVFKWCIYIIKGIYTGKTHIYREEGI
jgi:serine/threonine protein kinase